MRTPMAEILKAHGAAGTAAGAFTCYGLEGAAAAVGAAEDHGSTGVILLLSPQAFESPLGGPLLTTLVALADSAGVPVCVELDHCPSLDAIERALTAGAGAALADGSKLPFEENVTLSSDAVRLADARGAQIEVELGHIAGNEEAAQATAAAGFTDPSDAQEFVECTGAACLAVSIGNVHGHYASEPELDFGLLGEIRERVSVPLALHGASGLPDELVSEAIAGGITKINVNTELRGALVGALEAGLPAARDGLRVLDLATAGAEAIGEIVRAKLELFEPKTAGGSR